MTLFSDTERTICERGHRKQYGFMHTKEERDGGRARRKVKRNDKGTGRKMGAYADAR